MICILNNPGNTLSLLNTTKSDLLEILRDDEGVGDIEILYCFVKP